MRRDSHEAGQIAKRYIADKLKERNYRVESAGKVLSVRSPGNSYFKVKVTSLSRRNAWIVRDEQEANTYYVLVFKPDAEEPSFFVLNQEEMRREKRLHQEALRHPIPTTYSNPDLELQGLSFEQPFGYSERWGTLPQ
jgi:hypothetical protein